LELITNKTKLFLFLRLKLKEDRFFALGRERGRGNKQKIWIAVSAFLLLFSLLERGPPPVIQAKFQKMIYTLGPEPNVVSFLFPTHLLLLCMAQKRRAQERMRNMRMRVTKKEENRHTIPILKTILTFDEPY